MCLLTTRVSVRVQPWCLFGETDLLFKPSRVDERTKPTTKGKYTNQVIRNHFKSLRITCSSVINRHHIHCKERRLHPRSIKIENFGVQFSVTFSCSHGESRSCKGREDIFSAFVNNVKTARPLSSSVPRFTGALSRQLWLYA